MLEVSLLAVRTVLILETFAWPMIQMTNTINKRVATPAIDSPFQLPHHILPNVIYAYSACAFYGGRI